MCAEAYPPAAAGAKVIGAGGSVSEIAMHYIEKFGMLVVKVCALNELNATSYADTVVRCLECARAYSHTRVFSMRVFVHKNHTQTLIA